MSETRYQREVAEKAMRLKQIERIKAHLNLVRGYEEWGMNEDDRDEVLAALGISTLMDAVNSHGSYVDRALSRAGLGASVQKSVIPRTPPTRAI